VVVPRAKAETYYRPNQLLFREAVSHATNRLGKHYINGSHFIERRINTKTTHLRYGGGDGSMPYPGITNETCYISNNVISKDILLIDDLYTKTINTDEDVIQSLLDKGARSVTFYSIGKTEHGVISIENLNSDGDDEMNITVKLLAAIKLGIIPTNANFYQNFYSSGSSKKCIEQIYNNQNPEEIERMVDNIEKELGDSYIEFVSVFDENFPTINGDVKNNSEKPFIFSYRGDISLLRDLNKNVAIIGLIDPTEEIEKRERSFVEKLVEHKMNIVSGLAKGCDTIAHRTCIDNGGKTIAILPSPINTIIPAENRELAEEIVNSGGLLISEYFEPPKNKFDATKRYTDRDRLQAMFAKAIILTASYRYIKEEKKLTSDGKEFKKADSGSRHAMEAAKRYHINRYMLFNKTEDSGNPRFGLNEDYLKEDVKILTKSNINNIISENAQKEKISLF
jgi:DNA processing protein